MEVLICTQQKSHHVFEPHLYMYIMIHPLPHSLSLSHTHSDPPSLAHVHYNDPPSLTHPGILYVSPLVDVPQAI